MINLHAKLRIYDVLTLSKKMKESLIRALFDLKIFLDYVGNIKQAYEVTPIAMEEILDTNLLNRTIIHNRPLYISINFSRFRVAKMLVNLDAYVNIISLTTIMYLNIEIFRFKDDGMMLRGLN